MTSDWRPVLNNYLSDFESQTTVILDKIVKLLSRSGQRFDTRIKEHFKKSVLNRLEQSLEFIEIQNESHPHQNEIDRCQMTDATNEQMSSDDTIEFVESVIKVETISSEDDENAIGTTEGISTTSEAEPAMHERMNYRPSLDSCFSMDRHSTCSPSTSNQPMVSPNVSPNISPFLSSTELNMIIKREIDHTRFDECVVKMEDVPTTSASIENEIPPSPSHRQFQRSVSILSVEQQEIKRKTVAAYHEPCKKQKITDVVQMNESIPTPNNMPATKDFVFACFYSKCQINLFITTLQEVYGHWKDAHEMSMKPFRFVAIGKAACFYCNKVDVFPQLVPHHKHRHHSEIMVIVDKENKSKCGLCHRIFSSSEMVVHFKQQHDPSLLGGINSPVCFSEAEVTDLLKINSTPNGLCEFNSAVNGPNEIKAFVCGFCGAAKSLSETSFIDHIENDIFKYSCSACSFLSDSIHEITQHEETVHHMTNVHIKHKTTLDSRLERYYMRTRVIFSNGLALFKHNLLNTKFDDRSEFWSFKERFVKQKSNEGILPKMKDDDKLSDFHRKELKRQRAYHNNLCIRGIMTVVGQDELHQILAFICKVLHVEITKNDFDTLFQRSGFDVIVKMRTFDLKKQILKHFDSIEKTKIPEKFKGILNICSLIDLKMFSVENDLTGFFRELYEYAQMKKDKMHIHSVWISDRGISVKVTFKSPIEIIWTKTDLDKCIHQKYKGLV
ncbi:uncharacterized protein LOC116352242 [Contarinia nasturtii]|uniref:uncharacterized protein LOC116352242 n=1 Tax=Contarinia nasturtii TaxID=265458 RepID=UPI0012D4BD44|nr:uncharacterized protein LOC116352242 [Contarinia nasturtii]